MPGTQKVTKSSSLGSMKGGPTTPLIMDQDDIIALTQNVKNFSDALAKLKTTFTEKIGENSYFNTQALDSNVPQVKNMFKARFQLCAALATASTQGAEN
ncbi:hypothetical protein SNE40_018329 [Patella caerulea]|uniref:Uncharacterized protein n=1 Tax=Patella caerulea TaxID=87958 RepID=A0AAN8JAI5_PATCE